MKMRITCIPCIIAAIIVGTLCFPASAQAQHSTSVTISPIHLLYPVFEVTGEFKASEDVGTSGILGVGSYDGFSVFEAGGQVQYYIIGSFDHGMQLGGELLYVNLSGDNITQDVSGIGNGLSFSGYAGYKIAAGFGLTFNIQAGLSLILVRASAEDSIGNSASTSGSSSGVLLNLNLGWSF